MPELRAQGEGKTPRRCPVCGSRRGRVGCAPRPGGAMLRGWLCFDCGYFPGKGTVLQGTIDRWDIEDWAAYSRKGEVCGILGCQSRPVVKCDHCGNMYCQEHAFVLNTPAHPEREFIDWEFCWVWPLLLPVGVARRIWLKGRKPHVEVNMELTPEERRRIQLAGKIARYTRYFLILVAAGVLALAAAGIYFSVHGG